MAFLKVVAIPMLFAVFSSARPTLLKRDYAAASDVVSGSGDAWYSADTTQGSTTPANGYTCYYGNVDAYPAMSSWLSFDSLWSTNEGIISANNAANPEYVGYIQSAIQQVSQQSSVDPRVILAMAMQESTGNANAPCTGNGNCGLLQAPVGSTSLDASDAQNSILQMIQDGVQGTSQAPGYSQYMANDLSWVNNPYPGNPYAAARAYNSGSISSSGNLDDAEWGTPSYSNDIANRLLGWTDDASSDPYTTQCGS